MLDTLPSLPQSQFPRFISSLNRLVTLKPALFQPHLQPLLSFLRPRILPSTDAVSTPTESKPAPPSGTFAFPHPSEPSRDDVDGVDEEMEATMKAALEFMITLIEAGSGMMNDVDSWVSAIVRGCLDGMGTRRNDDLDEWLEADVSLCLFANYYRLAKINPDYCRLWMMSWTTRMPEYASTLSIDLLLR